MRLWAGQHGVAPWRRNGGRAFECEIEAGDHAARNVDQDRQPWTAERLPVPIVYDDLINRRVVNLYDL
jgi:hypothetical protein